MKGNIKQNKTPPKKKKSLMSFTHTHTRKRRTTVTNWKQWANIHQRQNVRRRLFHFLHLGFSFVYFLFEFIFFLRYLYFSFIISSHLFLFVQVCLPCVFASVIFKSIAPESGRCCCCPLPIFLLSPLFLLFSLYNAVVYLFQCYSTRHSKDKHTHRGTIC